MLFNKLDWPISKLLMKYGEYSAGEMKLFSKVIKKDWTVIEAGGHIGTLTIPLATYAKEVHVYEPCRQNFNYLCANIVLNECRNVKATRCAIGKEDGSIYAPILDPTLPHNTGGLILADTKGGESVPVRSLDSLGIPFKFLKADVEDMELDVLKGGRDIINHCKPFLYLECNIKHDELLAYIHGLGYQAWWHTPPLVEADNFYEEKDNSYPGIASLNMICCPKDSHDFTLPIVEYGKGFAQSQAEYLRKAA